MKKIKAVGYVALIFVMLFALAAFSIAPNAVQDEEAGAEGKIYKIGLCNAFTANDWQQNAKRCLEWGAEQDYFKDQCTVTIVSTEHTDEDQSAAIDTMVEQGYDALLIDPASAAGVNAAIQRAINSGVVCVLFDQATNNDDFYQIETDWTYVAETSAKFIAEALDGKGNILVDRGLPGSDLAQQLYDKAVAIFAEYPDIKIVGEFESQWAEGPAEAGVEACMTTATQIDAVYSQGYVACIQRAFTNAGRDIPVITGGGTNDTLQSALEYDYEVLGWQCNAAGITLIALQQALDILNGNPPPVPHQYMKESTKFLTLRPDDYDIGVPIEKIEEGVNTFAGADVSFVWPLVPADFPIQPKVSDIFPETAKVIGAE